MKDKIQLPEENDIKIRKTFPGDFDPSTKVEISKPFKKNRSSEKQNLKKILNNLENLDDLDLYE
jgi:hypothetical protein